MEEFHKTCKVYALHVGTWFELVCMATLGPCQSPVLQPPVPRTMLIQQVHPLDQQPNVDVASYLLKGPE